MSNENNPRDVGKATSDFVKWLQQHPLTKEELEMLPSEIVRRIVRDFLLLSNRVEGGLHCHDKDPHERCPQ